MDEPNHNPVKTNYRKRRFNLYIYLYINDEYENPIAFVIVVILLVIVAKLSSPILLFRMQIRNWFCLSFYRNRENDDRIKKEEINEREIIIIISKKIIIKPNYYPLFFCFVFL